MHIILGILGAIVTILILFNRLKESGIDLGWLNPFTWAHRRRWRKKYNADPAFMLESPMEISAGLMFVGAKCSGEMTNEERSFILEKFQDTFNLTSSQATDLLSSTAYLIKDEDKIFNKVDDFVASGLKNYSDDQVASTVKLVESVIAINDHPSEKQIKFLGLVKTAFKIDNQQEKSW